MRKFFGILLTVLVLTVIALALATVFVIGMLPSRLPPIVEQMIAEKIVACGFTPDVRLKLDCHWLGGPRIDGRLSVGIANSPWRIQAQFGATRRGWSLAAQMSEAAVNQDDPTLRTLHKRFPTPAVSNLAFSASVSLEAKASGGYFWTPPEWSVKVPVRNLSASGFSEDRPFILKDLSATPAVSGIAAHFDVKPTLLRARSLSVGDIGFTNVSASVHASEKSLLLTEAGAGFCGGRVTLYSLFLDMKSLNAGFTLFADDIDAGEALRHFRGFRGDASGRLHGKIRLFAKSGGRQIRLSDAFLYSTPGETGKLMLEGAEDLTQNLAYAGLDEATQANVADALTDLDYTALKLTLRRNGDKSATLTTHVDGTATRGTLTVPVNLTLNFHGDVEQLINLGLDYTNKTKGTKP